MFKRFSLLAIAGLALCVGTGCSNKTSAERDSLVKQNQDLAAERDAARKAQADAENRASASANQTPPEATPGTPGMEGATETGAQPPASHKGSADLDTGFTVG